MADTPTQDSSNQLIVALSIVGVLGMLGLGLIIGGVITKQWGEFGTGIGAVIGALGTALNAPTGISTVIKAASKQNDSQ